MTNPSPRVLFFDLETAGVNALHADLGFVICFGYKWLGEEEAHCLTIDMKGLREWDDSRLLKKASKLIEQADLLVGHFASVFDRRFFQGRLLINGLPPIPQTKLRDTCMIARSVANFSSNRLKHLANILKMKHKKLENDWPWAWFKVLQRDKKALDGLAHYCKGDVLALEELYLRLRPFDNRHPRLTPRPSCKGCSGAVQFRGTIVLDELRYRRFACVVCGKWGRETRALKE